jgi:hypothetical protein
VFLCGMITVAHVLRRCKHGGEDERTYALVESIARAKAKKGDKVGLKAP